ncbi:MAG: hypothetical protein R3B55_02355 [Candidatus Paceibacterota bacterium]
MSKHEVPQTDFGKDFSLVHEAVVAGRAVGADRKFWKALAKDPQLWRRVKAFVDNGKELFTPQHRAREIMGSENIFDPIWVDGDMWELTEAEMQLLERIPFPEDQLIASKDSHVLVALAPITFAELHKHYGARYFDSQFRPGRDDKDEFTKKRHSVGWHLVQKEALSGSMGESLTDQQKLLRENELIPTATLLAYTMVAYQRKNRKRLFDGIYVRTSSVNSGALKIMLHNVPGVKGINSIEICTSGGYAREDIGLAVETKPLW